jgi:predicted SAM-dependent methyltransferase
MSRSMPTANDRALDKLHLGCGRVYLSGYLNVDYPPSEHTVQKDLRADLYCDISTMRREGGSVSEIRLHHVFEHFPRPVALALLCRWRDWLVPGGTLHIETPDLLASACLLVSPLLGYTKKQQVIRHLFGSHESHWAVHWDGWYGRRFAKTLEALGFIEISIRKSRWGVLRNVEVWARRSTKDYTLDEYRMIIRDLLSLSMVTTPRRWIVRAPSISPSEIELLDIWLRDWERAYVA